MKSKKDVVSEFRQAEILTAARKVFAEKGYVTATVDEIAARAGLAKGTIYVYFKSKEQIYTAVLANDLDTLRDLLVERIAAADTIEGKIAAYVNTRFEYSEERRDFFRIVFMASSESPVLSRAKSREWLREPVQLLAAAFEKANATKQLLPWPAEWLAWTVADLTTGALQRRLAATPLTTTQEDADCLLKFICAATCPSAGGKHR